MPNSNLIEEIDISKLRAFYRTSSLYFSKMFTSQKSKKDGGTVPDGRKLETLQPKGMCDLTLTPE